MFNRRKRDKKKSGPYATQGTTPTSNIVSNQIDTYSGSWGDDSSSCSSHSSSSYDSSSSCDSGSSSDSFGW